jgi:hypothetical protein
MRPLLRQIGFIVALIVAALIIYRIQQALGFGG